MPTALTKRGHLLYAPSEKRAPLVKREVTLADGSELPAKEAVAYGKTPSVISDTGIREKVIPQIKSDAQKMLTSVQQTNPDGSPMQQGVSASETEPANEYESFLQEHGVSSSEPDQFYNSELKLLDNIQKNSDATTQNYIQSLKGTFDARRADTQAASAQEVGAARTLLASGGGMRSASGARLVSGVERAGIRELAALDAQEQGLKAQALAAQTENDYKSLGEKLNLLKEKRAEKLETVDKMWGAKAEADAAEADAAKEKAKEIGAVVKAAAENGATPEVLKAIGNAQDTTEAWMAAGDFAVTSSGAEGQAYTYAKRQGYTGSPLDFHREWEAAGRKPDTGGTGSGSGGGGSGSPAGYSGDYAGTIARAANKMASVSGAEIMKSDLQNAVAAQDWGTAAGLIIDASTAGLTAENRTKVQNAQIDSVMLTNMQSSLQKLADAGYDTNLLTGTVDEIQKKIGVLKTDAKYATIAAELDRNFQQYRQNMTGAAFGDKESSEYAKVNPSKSNTLELNKALIEGALNYSNNYVQGVVKSATGEGGVDILKRGTGTSPADAIVQKDNAEKDVIADWAAASDENYSMYNAFIQMFPNASPQDIKDKLGIP